jgi:hypothetical protein
MILLASATEMAASLIASLYLSDAEHVRKVVHEFNDRWFGSLDPNYRGGRPKKVTRQQRDEIVSVEAPGQPRRRLPEAWGSIKRRDSAAMPQADRRSASVDDKVTMHPGSDRSSRSSVAVRSALCSRAKSDGSCRAASTLSTLCATWTVTGTPASTHRSKPLLGGQRGRNRGLGCERGRGSGDAVRTVERKEGARHGDSGHNDPAGDAPA